jgi:hypothetical protein
MYVCSQYKRDSIVQGENKTCVGNGYMHLFLAHWYTWLQTEKTRKGYCKMDKKAFVNVCLYKYIYLK